MMNKQQLIKKLGYVRYSDTDDERYNYYNKGIDTAISFAKKLAEPEKPIVPQCVADMIIERKKLKQGIVTAIRNLSVFKEAFAWISENEEAFAKAWFYGYEVEKEKLYTVKFSNEDFGKTYIGIIKTANKIGISTVPINDECSKCYFTKSELEEFKFWNNPAFEIKEVTE